MSRWKALGSIIRKVIQQPSSLYRVLERNVEDPRFSIGYVRKKYQLDRLPSVTITDLLGELDQEVKHYSFLEGTSLLSDIGLLMGLADQRPDCDYMEIGTWRGESIANVASVAKNCVSITLGKEEMRQMGFPEKVLNMQGIFLKDIPNIRQVFHNSNTLDFASLNQKFDVIFIDGDHATETIASDTRNAFSLLKNERSVIVWHDYGWNTEHVRPNTLAGILDGCPPELRKHLYHVHNTKCAIFTRDQIPTFRFERNALPRVNFSARITAKPM